MEAGFIAGQKGYRAGVVGEEPEGEPQVDAGIEFGQLPFDLLLLDGHFVVHERDFDDLQATDAPFRSDDFFD